MSFQEAEEVKKIADQYIEDHHEHLRLCDIRYYFTSDSIMRKGVEVPVKWVMLGKVAAHILTEDLEEQAEDIPVLLFNRSSWELLAPESREAWVDHALCELWFDTEKRKYSKLAPDVYEYNAVVRRHGAYMQNLKEFLKAAKQPAIPGMEDARGAKKRTPQRVTIHKPARDTAN